MAEALWRTELYFRLIAARVQAQLQYRVSFSLDLCGTFILTFVDFLAVVVLFSHLPRLAGWTLPEVAFFYGTANISFACADLLVGHMDLFPQMIRTGSFDLMLVRPVGTLFQMLSSDLALRRVGRVLQGTVVLLFALSRLDVSWTPPRAAMLVLMLVTGVVIYSCIWITASAIAFWAVEVKEISNAFTYGGSFLASYPINIFGGWTRRLMAFVIPLAFVSYFPGLYVLDRHDPLGLPDILRFCPPVVAVLLVVITNRIWRFGVGFYRSTGS